ncbi:MAG: hypothetical protein ACQESR_22225 [Planctomycetota bacterium]
MKIVNEKRATTNEVLLCLTPSEAKELSDTAGYLALHPENHHAHVSSSDYRTEITVAVYTRENLHEFSEDLRELLGPELEAD